MANPIEFPSTTPNLSLPLLFLGQSQKEPFINQALSMLDTLAFGIVDNSLASPPSTPDDGSAFRILDNADGEWAGHDGELALWIGGAWSFISPSDGLAVFDQTARTTVSYNSAWETASEPIQPTGGTTVDTEARTAISGILDALRVAGILPNGA